MNQDSRTNNHSLSHNDAVAPRPNMASNKLADSSNIDKVTKMIQFLTKFKKEGSTDIHYMLYYLTMASTLLQQAQPWPLPEVNSKLC